MLHQHRPPSAREHYLQRLRLQAITLASIRRQWALMGADFDSAWAAVGPRILVLLSAAQLSAAADSSAYATLAALEQGLDPTLSAAVNARAFIGSASDGRSLVGLLSEAVILAKTSVGAGSDVPSALAMGGRFLDLVTPTQVADAGRNAELVTMTATPSVGGYVRMLNTPSCSRCVILAGKRYRWDNNFRRHPKCDCFTIAAGGTVAAPAKAVSPEGYFRSLSTAEQNHWAGSKANADAIREGASPITVVNANRGTYTPTGRSAPTPGARPTPGAIYHAADGDRDRALELLKAAGYLT